MDGKMLSTLNCTDNSDNSESIHESMNTNRLSNDLPLKQITRILLGEIHEFDPNSKRCNSCQTTVKKCQHWFKHSTSPETELLLQVPEKNCLIHGS
jgi:hypothetical protein